MEVWRNITDYPNYMVSNTGLVRSRYKVLNPSPTSNGYLKFTISNNGVRKHTYVHHLVAQEFIGPRPIVDGIPMDIDHLDRVKTNNHVSNLKYCSHKENCKNRTRLKLGCVYRKKNRYCAQIKYDLKTICKYFLTEQEARDWLQTFEYLLHQ